MHGLGRLVIAAIAGLSACAACIGLTFPAAAADLVPLRLDFFPSGYHAPLFYGLAKGFYKDVDVDLQITDGKGTNLALQAVAAGNSLIVLANYSTMLQAIGSGMPVVGVGGLIQRLPDAVVSLQGTPIFKPRDLEGKTIGIPPASAVFKLFPAFALATGIDTSKIRIVQTDSAATMTALLNGQVDAATGWPFTDARRVAAIKPINPPIVMSDYGVNVLGNGFVVRKDTAATKGDILRRFMAATAKSYAEAAKHPAAAIDSLVAARPDLEPAAMLEQLTLMPPYLQTPRSQGQPFGWTAADDWKQTYELLKQYFGMKEEIDVSLAFTNEFVPAN
jgi:NitT/TauT family transport system substrate-binding protein